MHPTNIDSLNNLRNFVWHLDSTRFRNCRILVSFVCLEWEERRHIKINWPIFDSNSLLFASRYSSWQKYLTRRCWRYAENFDLIVWLTGRSSITLLALWTTRHTNFGRRRRRQKTLSEEFFQFLFFRIGSDHVLSIDACLFRGICIRIQRCIGQWFGGTGQQLLRIKTPCLIAADQFCFECLFYFLHNPIFVQKIYFVFRRMHVDINIGRLQFEAHVDEWVAAFRQKCSKNVIDGIFDTCKMEIGFFGYNPFL